jgi:hypothetical protein
MKKKFGLLAVLFLGSSYVFNTAAVLVQGEEQTVSSKEVEAPLPSTYLEQVTNNELTTPEDTGEISSPEEATVTSSSSSSEVSETSSSAEEPIATSSTEAVATASTTEEISSSELSSESQSKEDATIEKNSRAVDDDGFVEVATEEELKLQIESAMTSENGEPYNKIRITAPLTLTEDLTIARDLTIDWGGLEHNFGNKHIYISEKPKAIEFQNFKGTADHPGGLTASIDTNAMIRAYSTGWVGEKYYFTGTLTFTGSLDLYNGSKLGLVYAPRATVVMDGVSGTIDVQPEKAGLSADPGKAYFVRSYQLNVINGSQLTGPYLGKFYGYLGNNDEKTSDNSDPGLHILSGSKISLSYARPDNVGDEGEAVDTLPSNVTFEVSGAGSEFNVTTQINITNDNNRGIIQMRGSGSKVLVSDGGKIQIESATTAAFRLQGDSSQINVSSGGQIKVELVHDDDQPGNNGMRFVGKGLSLTVDGAGSIIDIFKESGKSSAIRFENGSQTMTVTNGGTLRVHNVGDGHEYKNRQNQGNQAIQFYDASGWLESPGSADFTVSGEKSNIDIRADSGATIDTTGDIDLNFTAKPKTYMVMIGKTGEQNTGIISGDGLNVSIDSPTYFDFQNKRVGSSSSNAGGWVFQGNGTSTLKIQNSEIALWRKSGAIFNNFEKDPDYFSDLGSLSVDGTDLGTFQYSSDSGLTAEFNATAEGMKSYNRISANNQIPIVDDLRVPTNADKKIYGHVSVPEGVDATPRDAWNEEVEVTLRITYADTSKGSVDITALTKGQGDSSITAEAGYNPWGEGERGGLFEVIVPDDQLLTEGDKVQVIAAKKVKGNHTITELDTQKTTVDVTPPEPATVPRTTINAATNNVQGTGTPGSTAILLKGSQVISQGVVGADGKFKLTIPVGSLNVGDSLDLVLNDNAGEASAKGVVNKPSTNNDQGNQNPTGQAVTYHDAAAFEPGIVLTVEGGLSMLAPMSIDFGTIKATGITQEKPGTLAKDDNQLIVYDQRETKGEWMLTVSLNKPLTNVDDETVVLSDALYFNDQLLTDEKIPVVEGKNQNDSGVDYSSTLKEGAAFEVVLDKEKQIVGKYSGEVEWTLSDVPTGGAE